MHKFWYKSFNINPCSFAVACCKSLCYATGEQNLVVLFDQHAAHERVRLEALLNGRIAKG